MKNTVTHIVDMFMNFILTSNLPLAKSYIYNHYQAQYGCAPGIVRTKVGYAGGTTPDPSYRSLGDHTEVIELEFDPGVTSFGKLLEFFWSHHDPHSAKACARYSQILENKARATTSKYPKPVCNFLSYN